ncbi:hypothetical protein KOR42_52700 [Thalassoglobus neptunius]|uniref:Uncharacterized protein n=1 Tax=Thalassoglobus neptunius TaxID=1938619 RepID=A0A5C5V920_9PLAN|nr:hypothetical protein [Thalassoglobus neptunius]TWT35054.1 hypothetical protein KOR42_52700 [Thalassoglobus neptunius]
MFYRLTTDGRKQSVDLRSLYAGPTSGTCWGVGGGPSLRQEAIEQINVSPAPVFSMNLAGSGLIRPDFWTSYDPTARFHRSIYLDASILKFVHRTRAMDLIPETTFKVCDAPATLFFERSREPGFAEFPTTTSTAEGAVADWQDSLIQLIDIAYQLGFRKLFLVGCEMLIAPYAALLELGGRYDVAYREKELLGDFVKRCQEAGATESELNDSPVKDQYHFDEVKPLQAAIQTDFHYFRVAQYLRLSRRNMSLAGLELVSVTPGSRLNDSFPTTTVEAAVTHIRSNVGNPAAEQTRGRYTEECSRTPLDVGPMRDFRPHFWKSDAKEDGAVGDNDQKIRQDAGGRLQHALQEIPEVIVDLNEHA